MEAALGDRGRRSLASAVEAAWIELGGPATLTDASDLDNVRAYFDRLDRAERAGDLDDPAALEESLEDLYAAPDALADERLQLLTIHRAKGLEWDVVIVPGLGRAPAQDRGQLLRWLEFEREDGGVGLVLAPLKPRAEKDDALEKWLRRLDAERGDHELGRLLYVAATRAKRRLHLVAHLEPVDRGDDPGHFRAPRPRTALHALWPVLEADVTAAAREPQDSSGAAAGATLHVDLVRLPDDWVTPPAEERLPPAPGADAGSPREDVPFEWVTAAGRYAGTVVHEELERAGRAGLVALAAELDAREAAWRRRLRELGLAQGQIDPMVQRIRLALATTAADARGRWLFDPAHREATGELALTAKLDGRVVSTVIDRTFVDSDGVRWIVDFKTSAHEGGDLEAFLDRERERHARQLETYAAVVRLLEPERPLRLGLYFPLHAGWREWAPGEFAATT
jgi:ATP-dependent exoDNAse (exonuclease V) beta subunit